jgi:spore maturation protein CgeB
MRFVMFYHSLVSDWNHGNAHYLRGIVSELLDRGHQVDVWEPENGWSVRNLLESEGPQAIDGFKEAYPRLSSSTYTLDQIDLEETLRDADVVIVHEWTDPQLVRRIGEHHRTSSNYQLLFHDTHHRAVSSPEELERFDLSAYDGVLAFGDSLRQRYARLHPELKVWVWHEAADTRLFKPVDEEQKQGELIWIGNWGDDERTAEIHEFLLTPIRHLQLAARVYGVRYPQSALEALAEAGATYGGWAPNYRVPELFAHYYLTVHIPRRPYREMLPGIPTIRMFEALTCGIPLVSAPWDDCEGLFRPGQDYLVAHTGAEMECHLKTLLERPDLRQELRESGLETIRARHTCAHRVDELMAILN